LLVMRGTRDNEQELHKRFSEFRIGREWFRCSAPIEKFISQHTGISLGESPHK
jgi:hypothetical protein